MPPHVGRGGWTWYTGSAGWLQRAGIESILGLSIEGEGLVIAPCIPPAWPGFTMTLRYRGAVYEITVENPDKVARGVLSIDFDGVRHAPVDGRARLRLAAEGAKHSIVVTLGPALP
jgi:cyclic beta-1,2-glucan synthetase